MAKQLLAPWTRTSTWWQLVYLVLDLLVGIVTFTTVVVLAGMAVGLVVLFPLAVLVVWSAFVVARVLCWFERSRVGALLGADLNDAVPDLERTSWLSRLLERVSTPARWRELAYLLLRLPLSILTTTTVLLVWCGSAAMAALPLYVTHLPESTARFGLVDIGPGPGAWAVALAGITGFVLVAPWLTVALASLDLAVARWLLARDVQADLEAQVTELETSRQAAVGSAESERRRIERDLHDGAQQRLVALALDLGTARERMETDPAEARRLVAAAHEEVKAALRELRALVRGIHPVILEDRGLDAALSAVVARSPVPVQLEVDVRPRPSPAVESTAYFVVSEALTNVARHSEATSARVSIARRADLLVIEVSDDGIGGADTVRGTGLAGLEERVSAHGGWVKVLSPAGGPTTVMVEVPCAS